MVSEGEVNVDDVFHTFEFENDFWKWRIDFEYGLDCEPGILGITELIFKSDINLFQQTEQNGYYGDLLCQNTSLGTRNNFLDLIQSKSLDEYFEQKFSFLQKLEQDLGKKYIVKIPFPLKNVANWDLNNRIRETYRIELFRKEDESPVAVLIPLVDERRNNSYEAYVNHDWQKIYMLQYEERMEFLNKGYYRLYVFPSCEKILECETNKYFDWSINCRNFYIYTKRKNVPFFSEDLRVFSLDLLETFIEKISTAFLF
jgi:hypothetical protein